MFADTRLFFFVLKVTFWPVFLFLFTGNDIIMAVKQEHRRHMDLMSSAVLVGLCLSIESEL